jgi:hypothetical protein
LKINSAFFRSREAAKLEHFEIMTVEQKIEWLNERDPFRVWALESDVFCLHCDGVFKAQDVACDGYDEATCPVCRTSGPVDFAELPWWREDLTAKARNGYEWRLVPMGSTAGRPGRLPPQKEGQERRCMICNVPVSRCCC